MASELQPLNTEQQLDPTFIDRLHYSVHDLRVKFGRVTLVGLLTISSTFSTFVAEEAVHPETVYADALSYPWSDATYIDANYDWGYSTCPDSDNGCMTPFSGTLNGIKYGESDPWGYYLRNCTSYVAWKLNSIGISSSKFQGLGNGGNWYSSAPTSEQTKTPKAWDAAVVPGTTSNPAGHVAFVESVNSDGTITVSEYNHDRMGNGDTRTGTASSMGFTEFVDFGLHPANEGGSGGSGSSSYPDGTFLKVNESQAIYRMVGGAPVRIYNQGAIPDFNGTVTNISNAALGAMPNYPTDGEFISIAETGGSGVYEFVGGAPVREYNWGALPNFHGAISVNSQSLGTLDHMLARPKDGAVVNIQEAGGSGIYEFVGGAPVRLYNQGAIPNLSPAVNINYQSLTTLDHMNAVPADGSAVSVVEAGGAGIYRFVGGAPIRLFNWGAVPDMPNVVVVNQQTLSTFDHMNARPSDGSVVNLVEAGGAGLYEFAGGAPLRLFNWGIIPGLHNAININAESVGDLDHMNAVPINGEFIASTETGLVYRVAGGAALRLYNQSGIPGYNGSVMVNQQTLDTNDHLNTVPVDGTIIEGVTSQTYWDIIAGKRTQVSAQSGAMVVDEQTIANIPTS